MIRLATAHDIPRILEIYASAKSFMRTSGNPNQWNGAYPDKETLICDIEKDHLFVMFDDNLGIYGCFALIGGNDPTYSYIEGKWKSTLPYGTIHRIEGDGRKNGVFAECTEFSRTRYSHLRVDTHEDNKPMQRAILRDGFNYAGIIYLENGDPRLAYEWILES